MNDTQRIFFQKLNELCKEHKVNLDADEVTFHEHGPVNRETYSVTVNGGWDIRSDAAQTKVYRVEQHFYDDLMIPGEKEV